MRERRSGPAIHLRPAILRAVLEIASDEGWHSLTIRKIADKIRYSPPMIYAFFASKEALCSELVADGYQLLYRHLTASGAGLADPPRRLWMLLRALRLFAWENGAHYQAMFGMAPITRPGEHPRLGEYAGACMGLLGDALYQCIPADPGRALPPLRAAKAVMAAGHGVIAMHLAGIIADRQEADELYDQVLRGLLAGWGM